MGRVEKVSSPVIAVMLWLGGLTAGCGGLESGADMPDSSALGGGGGASGNGANGGAGANGANGANGVDGGPWGDSTHPCTGLSDPRLVVAPQRLVKLTRLQVINTIGTLIGGDVATQILGDVQFSDVTDETGLRFPPLVSHGESAVISGDPTSMPELDAIAQTAAKYVGDHFAAVTGCTTSTDACATTWINEFAAGAYRRPLSAPEQSRVSGLYSASKSQTFNQWQITSTVEEATQNTVYGILISPQMVWRSEIGDSAHPSTSPPGVPLTDYELASLLSYTITNGPPDGALLADAASGMLRANLVTETQRLLAMPSSRSWLTTMMFIYYRLNLLYDSRVDPTLFPPVAGTTLADMYEDAHRTLDDTLWNGTLTDLLLSRTAFVNANLATNIYQVPVPPGASDTNFVQTTLPADQRSGLLTNAAFMTSRAGSNRESLVQRALLVKDTLLCLPTPPPPASFGQPEAMDAANLPHETAQEQVATRVATSTCKYCHASIDPFGLALDAFDDIARWRTTEPVLDANGNAVMKPVDPHTRLPDWLGGAPVTGAADMAQKLAASDVFTDCLARNALQLAMAEYDTSAVEMPSPPVDPADPYPPPTSAGCAALDVAARYGSGAGKTFSDLWNATVTSPGFALRQADR